MKGKTKGEKRKKDFEVITIFDDENSEMMLIKKDEKVIFEGNYWDFSTNPQGIIEFLKKCGVSTAKKKYVYGEEV